MDPLKQADNTVTDAAPAAETVPAPSQEPAKTEVPADQPKQRTKREKLEYTKKRVEEQIAELNEVEGIKPEPAPEDGVTPLTAFDLADEISDQREREAVKEALKLTSKDADPKEALKFARAAVNSTRNSMFREEAARKPDVLVRAPTSSGAPAKVEAQFVPTAEEALFMQTMGLKEEDIVKARTASEAQQQPATT